MTKNKQVCTECITETGGCCTEVQLCVHIDELESFKEKFDTKTAPKGHTLTVHNEVGDVFIYNSQEDPCMFLDQTTNQCQNYENRPLICRTYPIMWQEKGKGMNHFVDFACPLAHMVPIRELHRWAKVPKNKEYMEKMGELVFKTSYTQYVNLTILAEEVEPQHLLDIEMEP
ncbi:MAG: YkgJ family cysteine cluster protein [Candidatus Kariarchaeaceae archaeon]